MGSFSMSSSGITCVLSAPSRRMRPDHPSRTRQVRPLVGRYSQGNGKVHRFSRNRDRDGYRNRNRPMARFRYHIDLKADGDPEPDCDYDADSEVRVRLSRHRGDIPLNRTPEAIRRYRAATVRERVVCRPTSGTRSLTVAALKAAPRHRGDRDNPT